MSITYDNLLVAGGRFENDGGDIETVTVDANTTLKRGTLLGKITATGKYVVSLNAASDGSEVAKAVLDKDIVNDTAAAIDKKEVVRKKGTFNSVGVTFGAGQTLQNTKDDLHNVSIEITEGVL